jgi:ABC-type molybdenum transport system ATPase subunit/photorepair protein PhrA
MTERPDEIGALAQAVGVALREQKTEIEEHVAAKIGEVSAAVEQRVAAAERAADVLAPAAAAVETRRNLLVMRRRATIENVEPWLRACLDE